MIKPEDFRRERYNNLEMIVETLPVDYRGKEYGAYSPEQLRVIAEVQREAELRILLIFDVIVWFFALIFWWGIWY